MVTRDLIENAIYNIVRKTIRTELNVNDFRNIIDVLADETKNNEQKSKELVAYFIKYKVYNIIKLMENNNITLSLLKYNDNVPPFSSHEQIKLSLVGIILNILLNYIKTYNTIDINKDKLMLLSTNNDNVNNQELIDLFNSVIKNHSISNILDFNIKSGLYNYAKTLYDDAYKELTLPILIWQTFTNTTYVNALNSYIYIEQYKQLRDVTTDKELLDTIHNTINKDYLFNVIDDKSNKIVNLFFNYNINLLKDDKNPLPIKKVKTVKEFLYSFNNDENVDKVKQYITKEVYDRWNNILIEVLNKSIELKQQESENIKDISTLLLNKIYIDNENKVSYSLQKMLITIFSENNINILEKTSTTDNTGLSNTKIKNLLQGIYLDIYNICKNNDICKLKESLQYKEFFNKMKQMVNDKFTNESITKIAEDETIWETKYTAIDVINTLYFILTHVTEQDECLYILYATLMPSAIIK